MKEYFIREFKKREIRAVLTELKPTVWQQLDRVLDNMEDVLQAIGYLLCGRPCF